MSFCLWGCLFLRVHDLADNEKLITGQPGNILKNEAQAGKDTAPCWPAALSSREVKGQNIRTSLCNKSRDAKETSRKGPQRPRSAMQLPVPPLPSEWPQERSSEGKCFIHKERKETNEMACDIFFPLTLFRKTLKGKGLKSQKCKYFYKVYVLVLFWHLTKRW